MPFTIITANFYVSNGGNQYIPLPSNCDMFVTENFTQVGGAGTVCIGGKWYGPLFGTGASAANDGIRYRIAGSNALIVDKFSTSTASNGFTFVPFLPNVEAQAANAITAITNANPAVVSQTNTYSNGDILRIYNTTGMLTIAGMDFQISSVSGSGYTLAGLPATASNGFAAAGTSGALTRRVGNTILAPLSVNPEMMYITNISNATQAVVSTSVDPALWYAVGMEVHFSVPSSFGMTQMNKLTGTILAIDAVAKTGNIGAYNMTVNINSSAFSPFAFPASALSPTTPLFATLSPAGASTQYNPVTQTSTGYNFDLQPFRTANFTPGIIVSGGAASPGGANLDVINYVAYKFEN
jgi:hypothetical protein